jgi:hypothetical protein
MFMGHLPSTSIWSVKSSLKSGRISLLLPTFSKKQARYCLFVVYLMALFHDSHYIASNEGVIRE